MNKVIIPINDKNATRNSVASAHFGRAAFYYLVNDVDDESKDQILVNDSDHFGGVGSPVDIIVNQNAALITTAMGPKAIERFNDAGVAVYQGSAQDALGQMIEKFKNNELGGLTEGCSHSHDEGEHHHH